MVIFGSLAYPVKETPSHTVAGRDYRLDVDGTRKGFGPNGTR